MSVGFRKSFFGFNCDDVLEYIEKTHRKFAKKEKSYNDDINSLKKEIDEKAKEYDELKEKCEKISAELKEYNDRYDEIERLSQNIGKLYLVAESNANAIMKKSAENCQIANSEIERNINSIDNAHTSLCELKEKILATSNEFANEVDDLLKSLDTAKEQVKGNIDDTNGKIEDFENLFAGINK